MDAYCDRRYKVRDTEVAKFLQRHRPKLFTDIDTSGPGDQQIGKSWGPTERRVLFEEPQVSRRQLLGLFLIGITLAEFILRRKHSRIDNVRGMQKCSTRSAGYQMFRIFG